MKMIIHNMFVILVKQKAVKRPDVTGDGTGYSLTVTKHYRSIAESRGEEAKSNEAKVKPASKPKAKGARKKLFTYAFALLDLESGMYVGYGSSLRSERVAFEAAMAVMKE